MKITGLSHIGLPAQNLEKSIRFYEWLGFRQIVRKDDVNGFDYVYMKNNDCVIGLPHKRDLSVNADRPSAGAIDHMALSCENLDEIYRECIGKEIKIISEGIESNDIWQPLECRCFMIEGPDKVRVEFQELKENHSRRN